MSLKSSITITVNFEFIYTKVGIVHEDGFKIVNDYIGNDIFSDIEDLKNIGKFRVVVFGKENIKVKSKWFGKIKRDFKQYYFERAMRETGIDEIDYDLLRFNGYDFNSIKFIKQ